MDGVAPYVGAWIESNNQVFYEDIDEVAPYVGAWIESARLHLHRGCVIQSLPMWERGLKDRTGWSISHQ
ncbi:hypothetical protein DJ90_4565 [Paenibacillus macerans]|uniref:Uncharacterized protein n=1 Tax=Paenibacillus macerans TaxID=44252 RepID=A0A090Z8Z7_PAEMA|nr:hypothetical protein DJ90_4565 [Paenibacillus macerans]